MTAEESLPGLRWLARALAFGRSDNGNVWPSALGKDLARALEGAPVGWYDADPGRLRHVPTTQHMMAVHREYEVALVESAWVVPQAVYAIVHFYLPLSSRAERARQELLAYEARGALQQAPALSLMADIKYLPSGPLKQITHIGKIDALDFVHRAGAEGGLIRSLAWDEDVCPTDSAARHFDETPAVHPVPPEGEPD